ncbi:CsbD family protein [Sphaerisporangium fuscum]|uniref:CsbD family protein n=1 Tax=Sphaerisporangium fuscum TaxID=2835868 RepID=UPI001BDDA493|nr:CsbD family protein [Sphaerisporangium fuscum]
MSADDKISNKAQEMKGKVKQGVGDVTGDEELRAEGQADESKGKLKQAGERVKDAAKNVKDAFKD